MKIGLTGGIGCGKSTALQYFGERGALVIESDALVREALAENAGVIEAVRAAFGDGVIDAEGKVDRGRLGGIVAVDSEKLLRLESILHPIVRQVWTRKVAEHDTLAVVEIPLLFEKNLEASFDFTVCVAASPAVKLERLRSRGLSESQIEWRERRQMPLLQKMERADTILINNGTREHLNEQIDLLLDQWGAA